jgi:AcrR family transcriptional regulator
VQTAAAAAQPIDGRSARALRTREAIVDACVSLIEEGELRPTAPRVAERAGVSVRSVFQHFADLPALHSAVTARITERIGVLLHPVDASMPFDVRTETFVRYRAVLLEAITPFRRAANVHGPFAPEIQDAHRLAVTYMRQEVERVFGPEFARIEDPVERREVFEAVAAVLSWSNWDALRTDGDCTVDEATAISLRSVRSLLPN